MAKGGKMIKLNKRRDYFMRVADKVASKIYRKYKNFYLSNAIDESDLKQEAKIIALQILKKHDKKIPMLKVKRIISKYVGLKFHHRKKLIGNKNKGLTKKMHIESPNYIDSILFKGRKKFKKPSLFFFELKRFCSKIEYEILYKKFKLNMNPTEISKEVGLTRRGVRFVYKKVLKKLKKCFPKLGFCVINNSKGENTKTERKEND